MYKQHFAQLFQINRDYYYFFLLLLLFCTLSSKDPEGLKQELKTTFGLASNFVSEAGVKVSEKAMALKRCRVMEMR